MKPTKPKEWLIKSKPYENESAGKRPHIEMDGRREIIICGCTKISEYGAETVILRCGSTGIRVSGKALSLVLLSGHVVAIRGSISGLEFL